MDYDVMRDQVLARGEGKIVENDMMLVDTGKFTSRCPKDRYIVDASDAHDNVGWGSINLRSKNLPLTKYSFCTVSASNRLTRSTFLTALWLKQKFATRRARRDGARMAPPLLHKHVRAPDRGRVGDLYTRPHHCQNSRAKFEQWQEEGQWEQVHNREPKVPDKTERSTREVQYHKLY